MKKNLKKLMSLCLALGLCCSLGATAFAAEINISGGSGSTPVNLTTTNDGIGGEVTPTKLSVILPTVLPVAMADDGTVVTASDCKIDRQPVLRRRPGGGCDHLCRFRLASDQIRGQVHLGRSEGGLQ